MGVVIKYGGYVPITLGTMYASGKSVEELLSLSDQEKAFIAALRADAAAEAERRKYYGMEMDLCGKCAALMKTAFTLKTVKTGVDMKVTCANCKKRRFGARYEVNRKED